MSHIFISYSTKNAIYAYQLADKLREEGFDVWIDNDELRSSDNWWESIVRALRAASAFVVIMTPASRQSRWVQREVALADNWQKPAFPLLLEGENFEIYVLTQFRSISDGTLPNENFYEDLARYIKREKRKGQDVTEESSAQAPNDAEIKAALVDAPKPEAIKKPKPKSSQSPAKKTAEPLLISKVKSILPKPFEWCEIPAGKVTFGKGPWGAYGQDKTFDVSAFYIAKYPITNNQYAAFVDADGYNKRMWWTDAGWLRKEDEKWFKPRYWDDNELNGDEYPIVGISWFEANAFCQWLRSESGEKITLPTEVQWQRAAQGDDDRIYPWGNEWAAWRCNCRYDYKETGKTSSVRRYGKLGDSPYNVTDMFGNVWEWCLTEYKTGSQTLNGINPRVLRGGSWYRFKDYSGVNHIPYRNNSDPDKATNYFGFRIALAID